MTSETRRRYEYRTKYGITLEQYDAMLAWQEGRCAICRKQPFDKRLAVDHCHRTKTVRGLLCSGCNFYLLGLTTSDPAKLRRAADYLENPPGIPLSGGPPIFIRRAERLLKKIRSKRPKKPGNPPL